MRSAGDLDGALAELSLALDVLGRARPEFDARLRLGELDRETGGGCRPRS